MDLEFKVKRGWGRCKLISQKAFIKSLCRSQVPHQFVDVSFTITDIKDKLANLCGNWLLQNDFENTLCEIMSGSRAGCASCSVKSYRYRTSCIPSPL